MMVERLGALDDYNRFFHLFSDPEFVSNFFLEDTPLVSYMDSVKPLHPLLPVGLESMLLSSQRFTEHIPLHGLTLDEATALNLFTRQGSTLMESLYFILNQKLSDINRSGIEPFLPYLRLFYEAIRKLKPVKDGVHCGLDGNMRNFLRGEKITSWGFSYGATSLKSIVENSQNNVFF